VTMNQNKQTQTGLPEHSDQVDDPVYPSTSQVPQLRASPLEPALQGATIW
jgi:hypothetical protein